MLLGWEKVWSDQRIEGVKMGEREVMLIMRAELWGEVVEARMREGRRRLVRRKWPRWFVAKVSSWLEGVRVRVGRFIMPALLIRRLMGGMVESLRIVSAAA